MLALFEAINVKFDLSALAGEVNGLWYGLAQQGTPLPLVTYQLVNATPDWTFTENFENATIQFSIWYGDTTSTAPDNVDPLEEICRLYGLLKTAFDEVTLTVTGYTCIRCNREASRLFRDPDGGWQYQADYRIQLQEA